jgi:hypothetical protein
LYFKDIKLRFSFLNIYLNEGGVFMPNGYNGSLNPYAALIAILIVLQWFRVGNKHHDYYGSDFRYGGNPLSPEKGLLDNGGLFIIAIFLLASCSCFKNY